MKYGELAEAAWTWVLDQVQWDDDGPWIPESLGAEKPTEFLHGTYTGVGGLAYALAEIELTRPWTSAERELAGGIAARVRGSIPTDSSISFFDGLVSSIGVLTVLGEPGVDAAVERALEIGTATGWQEGFLAESDSYEPGAVCNDLTLGTGGVLLGALWAIRHGVPAHELADRAIERLLAEQEETAAGVNWLFVPRRYLREPPPLEMPNLTHGLAGIAAVLALAGAELDRPELVETARLGAEHLITLGRSAGGGFEVPRVIPWSERHGDEYTYNWCHGPAGTALLFDALEYAGVDALAGVSSATWRQRLLDAVRHSGIPKRLHPGFWDNDGRCCGTAGVADAFLTSYQRTNDPADLAFATHLADTLVANAGSSPYWRFLEHKNDDPLLPPGIGWMQGAAGIATVLFRIEAQTTAVPRMDNWWAFSGARPRRW
ncbi:lanthionine synthetase LanC family protein [Kribbella sp. NPDC056951]|uniref:lanthionine synthetase LanC family protein n=1 Tax=Kribbella sp. NPDC056951 TaxID=3345978 RepID=UPI00363169DA